MALGRLSDPTDDDVRWFRQALIDATPAPLGRRWFVAALFKHSDDWADVLCTLVLDAGIDEVDPSLNRLFVEPCVTRFAHDALRNICFM